MKIFIFGVNGMLGFYINSLLRQNCKEVVGISRTELDVSTVTYDRILKLFNDYLINENDIIINCIGIIPQSKNINDTNCRNYFLINSLFPIMLSTIAATNNVKFIHITTDCVFSGLKGNYNELDCHDETNNYGVSKSLGELCHNSTIIRTSIIGEQLKNKYSLLEWVKSHNNENIPGYTNHLWNGVTCLQLAQIILKMIDENIWWSGVRHIYSPNSVTKHELVELINQVYGLNNIIKPIETSISVDKTLSSVYDVNSKFSIPDLKMQVEKLKHFRLETI
jgi:dTDP-4-dehydrorhamnose reductase